MVQHPLSGQETLKCLLARPQASGLKGLNRLLRSNRSSKENAANHLLGHYVEAECLDSRVNGELELRTSEVFGRLGRNTS